MLQYHCYIRSIQIAFASSTYIEYQLHLRFTSASWKLQHHWSLGGWRRIGRATVAFWEMCFSTTEIAFVRFCGWELHFSKLVGMHRVNKNGLRLAEHHVCSL